MVAAQSILLSRFYFTLAIPIAKRAPKDRETHLNAKPKIMYNGEKVDTECPAKIAVTLDNPPFGLDRMSNNQMLRYIFSFYNWFIKGC